MLSLRSTARKASWGIRVAIDDGEGHPDYLRAPSNACRPDPRNESSKFAEEYGLGRSLDSHHAAVSTLVLNDGVSEAIRIQFETSKNLYLYAWFVYRFYPVAELHAFTCLELALRNRFSHEFPPREHGPGLRKLLEHAIETNALKNEKFEVWRRTTELRARNRAVYELIERMNELGLAEAEFNEASVVVTDEDRDHDYLATLRESVPKIRNHYGHGSSTLHNQGIGTLRLVQEIINQLWPAGSEELSGR